MNYLRPAGEASDDVLERLKRFQKMRKTDPPRPLARDSNNSFDRTFHRFLQLPLELRIKIYRLAFIGFRDHHKGYEVGRPVGRMPRRSRLRSGKSIRPFSEDVRENQRALEGTPILAIAFTCRQVYLEAAPIYYGGIIWHFRSRQWLRRFWETLGPKNKIQGIGMGILEAVRYIRIKLHSSRMVALAAKFPRLTRLDVFNEVGGHVQVLLKEVCPALCPLKMPLLKTLNYGSQYNLDFPHVIWSRDDEGCGLETTKQWYHFHTSRQLRLFSDTIGQEMRDSIKFIHVQLDDSKMADEILKFKNLVVIRLLQNDRGASQISTFHTLRDILKCLIAGLSSLRDVEIQDPKDAANFLPWEDAVVDGAITLNQPNRCDSSSDESSREPTPVAWASS